MKALMLIAFFVVMGLSACSSSSSGSVAGVFAGTQAGDKIELNEDSSCLVIQGGQEFRGTYERQDGQLTLNLGISKSMALRLEGNQLIDAQNGKWTKR